MIIDLIIVGVILLVALISAKQGFVRTIISAVGFIAAIVVAFSVSEPLADVTYDKFIEPAIINTAGETSSESAKVKVDEVWDALPGVITNNAASLGLSKESIQNVLSDNAQNGTESALATISQKTIKPTCTKIISTVFAMILTILLLIVVKFLAKIINKAFSFSIVGKLNTALGGAVGLVKGVGIALILCEIIVLIISFTDNGIWIFNNENIAKTTVFKFLTNVF